MVPKKRFESYGPDDAPSVEPEITSVAEAAERGSRIDELRQMRKVIARRLDDESTAARDIASLSKRQMEISREIEGLVTQEAEERGQEVSTDDEPWSAEAV